MISLVCCTGRERQSVRGSVAGPGGGRGRREPRRIGDRINPVASTGSALRSVALQTACQAAAGHAQVSGSAVFRPGRSIANVLASVGNSFFFFLFKISLNIERSSLKRSPSNIKSFYAIALLDSRDTSNVTKFLRSKHAA